jgi:integrase
MELDLDDNQRSLYSLRHYYITQKILDNVPLSTIAKNCLTSTKIIEGYYDHVTSVDRYDELSGVKNSNGESGVAFPV